MECLIPARHLKAYAKIISTLSKIGEEMWIEAGTNRVKKNISKRTMN